jgi:hypothetical protein
MPFATNLELKFSKKASVQLYMMIAIPNINKNDELLAELERILMLHKMI